MWCESIKKGSGFTTYNYTSHSFIAASSSYSKSHCALLATIIRNAGWSSERTLYDLKTNGLK